MRSKNNLNPPNKNEFPPPAAAASPAVAAPPWSELPLEVTANILGRLGAVEILQSAQFVCATWWKLCHESTMWRVINIVHLNSDMDGERNCTTMCRRAVDRSQGQVIDLTIKYFGDNMLLRDIADRSSNLRRLTLACCYLISSTTLTAAVKKLPNLEELALIQIEDVDIEAIGISCPMLKSFTFGQCHHYEYSFEDDEAVDTCNEHALAIAKNMPNLCHLGLIADELDNEGLRAILDGCPRLESLDLRQCFGVDLGGAVGRRCSEQIKDLRMPSDSDSDYGYDDVQCFDDSDWPYVPDFDYDANRRCCM